MENGLSSTKKHFGKIFSTKHQIILEMIVILRRANLSSGA